MKHSLTTAIFSSLIVTAPIQAATSVIQFERDNRTETYTVNSETGSLEIEREGISNKFSTAVSSRGETYRALVSFNKGPALFYENAASSTSFQVYYTLKIKKDAPVVDCIYGNIRNAQNGTSIRKAICNLGKPLTSDYQDLIFPYSDKWIGESNTAGVEQLMAEPPQPVDIPVGSLGEIRVVLRYDSLDDLMSASPRTIAIKGTDSRDFGTANAYFVYDADGTTPLGLDVEKSPDGHTLERLDGTRLLEVKEPAECK